MTPRDGETSADLRSAFERVSRLYAGLSRVHQAIARGVTREDLFERICTVLVEDAGFRSSWVGWQEPPSSRLVAVASSGEPPAHVPQLAEDVVREGRACVSDGLAAVPLREDGAVRGVLIASCPGPADDHDKELELLIEASNQVSFALGNLAREARLRESEASLAEAQRIAHLGSWVFDLRSGALSWSDEIYRIFGLSSVRTPLTFELFIQAVHPDDVAELELAKARAECGVPLDLEHRIVRPDGAIRWVHELAELERDAAGQPSKLTGTVLDITDRRVARDLLEHANAELERKVATSEAITAALGASEAELRVLAEAMPHIVWITDPDGRHTYVNGRWTAYTGLALAETTGTGWETAIHPDDRAATHAVWREAERAGTFAVECRLRCADGTYRWWLFRGVPVTDHADEIIKWFGTGTDIDDVKRTQARTTERVAELTLMRTIDETLRGSGELEQALSTSMRLLAEHLGVTRCAYADVDADGDRFFVPSDHARSKTSVRGEHHMSTFGAGLAAQIRRGGAPLAIADAEAELGAEASGPLTALGIRAFLCYSLLRQGRLRAMMAVHHESPRAWQPTEIAFVAEVAERCWSSIEHRATQAKLVENEAMLRLASHAARLGAWSVELPSQRLTWSDGVREIHEVPPGTEPTVAEALEFYAPEFRDQIAARFAACVRDGTPFDLELQVITAKQRRLWVRAIGQAERTSEGQITRVLGAFQDIDDRRRLEDQLRQAQKMEAIGQLAGGVAHDFNNILSVILSYSTLITDDLAPDNPMRDDVAEIRRAAQRATELTRQLLAFSRKQLLQPRVIEIERVLAEMERMLRRLLGEDVELEITAAPGVGKILADPSQVEQIVMNLAVNARDAMPRGGKLTIAVTSAALDPASPGAAPSHVVVAITDTGVGMDAETRDRIFEPFFTRKANGAGTGLGLATVFGIVQQSGGHIVVESTPGKGTTFRIYFPRTEQPPREADLVPPDATPQRGSETVLLVEDEEQVRTVTCSILRRHGYTVLDAPTGDAALQICEDFPGPIHLLLTDVVMPRMSGRELAAQLGPRRPDMRVIFASGYTDDAVVRHGIDAGSIDFLQKPVTPSALLQKVREVLDRAKDGA